MMIFGGDYGGGYYPVGITLKEFLNDIGCDYIEEGFTRFYIYGTETIVQLEDKLDDSMFIYGTDVEDIITKSSSEIVEITMDRSEGTAISENILKQLKDEEKTLNITDGIITWTIEAEKIIDETQKITSTQISLTEKAPERVEKVEELAKELENVKYLNFEHHGKLPGRITVTVDVSKEYKNGQKLIVKHYNESENKLENEIEVEVKDGKITFEVESLSTYVLSEKIAKVEEDVKEEPKVEDTTKDEVKEEPKVEDTTKEDVKEETKKEDKKDKTPKTGDPIYIVFGILALTISIRITYAIINKKSKK